MSTTLYHESNDYFVIAGVFYPTMEQTVSKLLNVVYQR